MERSEINIEVTTNYVTVSEVVSVPTPFGSYRLPKPLYAAVVTSPSKAAAVLREIQPGTSLGGEIKDAADLSTLVNAGHLATAWINHSYARRKHPALLGVPLAEDRTERVKILREVLVESCDLMEKVYDMYTTRL